MLRPVLKGNASIDCTDKTCKVAHSFKKPPVKYEKLEFFGTSEFFYTMRDTLRIAGPYSARDFNKKARVRPRHVCVWGGGGGGGGGGDLVTTLSCVVSL